MPACGLLPTLRGVAGPATHPEGAPIMNIDFFNPHAFSPWLQGLMLLCFSLAWPLANVRLWRSLQQRRTALRVLRSGRGRGFTLVVLCGYLAGVATQLAQVLAGHPLGAMFWFYLVNAVSVAVHLALQVRGRCACRRAVRRQISWFRRRTRRST